MTSRLVDALQATGTPHSVGTSWTIDAPYRETIAEVQHYQAAGVLAVEMEAAALFAVAAYRGVEMGALLTISDTLGDLTWDPHFAPIPPARAWKRSTAWRCKHCNRTEHRGDSP